MIRWPYARRLGTAGISVVFVSLAVPHLAHPAVLCVQNKATGKFESLARGSADDACDPGDDAQDLLRSFQDVQRHAQQQGTRIVGGVIVTNNRSPAGAAANSAARAEPLASRSPEPLRADWEIVEADGTLQRTLGRWADAAGWQVVWEAVPDIQNPGYVKLPGRSFIDAVDYVIGKARAVALQGGFDLKATSYTNNVIVISKEAKQ